MRYTVKPHLRARASHMQYFWWAYVLVAVLVVYGWTTAFSILARPADNEQVCVVFFDRAIDVKGINAELSEHISEISDQNLGSVSFGSAEYGDEVTFMSQITSRLYSADIIILTEDITVSDDIPAWFKPIPDGIAEIYFADAQLYVIDGEVYGIYVYPHSGSLISSYYSGDDGAIAFFSPRSENVGGIYGLGQAEDMAAFELISYILGGGTE